METRIETPEIKLDSVQARSGDTPALVHIKVRDKEATP